jgi:hypothetical protein
VIYSNSLRAEKASPKNKGKGAKGEDTPKTFKIPNTPKTPKTPKNKSKYLLWSEIIIIGVPIFMALTFLSLLCTVCTY